MQRATQRDAVVVLGAGVIGLTTAITLRERGHTVQVWARDDGPSCVSGVAGAIWYPFLAEPRQRVLAWSGVTFRRLAALAQQSGTGVTMQRVVEVFASELEGLPWWAGAAGPIDRVPIEAVPPPYRAAICLDVPVCDVRTHLPWLRQHAERLGVTFVRRTLQTIGDAAAGSVPTGAIAPTVVNCTGLGAASLCGDRELEAVRGQVVVVARTPELADVPAWIDDTREQPFYVIPRGDELVLGGTAQHGDSRLHVDAADTQAILTGLAQRLPRLRDVVRRTVKVGLRPYRREVRLECETTATGQLVVHNYGHGGSGYTLAWGCAAEVADLLV